jgi:hypothetical protein
MILINYSTVPRKWKCPICRKKSYELVIDGNQLEIINKLIQ